MLGAVLLLEHRASLSFSQAPFLPNKFNKLAIIDVGGVGERLKPAVLKNKIADSLSDRKCN
jgi:hypothetical protein